MSRRFALVAILGIVALLFAGGPAAAGGPPDIGVLLKRKPGSPAKEGLRVNLDVGESKTVRMKLVSLTGEEEAGDLYEDTNNYPHTFKTSSSRRAGSRSPPR